MPDSEIFDVHVEFAVAVEPISVVERMLRLEHSVETSTAKSRDPLHRSSSLSSWWKFESRLEGRGSRGIPVDGANLIKCSSSGRNPTSMVQGQDP